MAYLSPPKNCAEQSMMIQLSVLVAQGIQFHSEVTDIHYLLDLL